MKAITVKVPVGTKVVRGPNWSWGNQDQGSVYGVVTSFETHSFETHGDTWVVVNWRDKNGKSIAKTYSYKWNDGTLAYYENSEYSHVSFSFLSEAIVSASDKWKNVINSILENASAQEILSQNYIVKNTLIQEAHKDVCDTWRKKLEKQFPDALKKEDEFYDFGEQSILSTTVSPDCPLFIGMGLAKDGEENKCLMVYKDKWEMIIDEGVDKYVIKFKKK